MVMLHQPDFLCLVKDKFYRLARGIPAKNWCVLCRRHMLWSSLYRTSKVTFMWTLEWRPSERLYAANLSVVGRSVLTENGGDADCRHRTKTLQKFP